MRWPRPRPPAAQAPHLELAGQRLPVEIRKLAQARRITLRLARDGSAVRISMPRWAAEAEALRFALSRREWLAAQLARLPRPADPQAPLTHIAWRGERLALQHDPAAPRRIRAAPPALHIGGPADSLKPRLQRWLKAEALRLLAADLAEYCARAGVAQPALALSSAQARWGSCSTRGVVRINWRLVMAPDGVRRSVVAHEVAHLVHFDHSPAFHALLASLFGADLPACDRWLKAHGRTLYLPFG